MIKYSIITTIRNFIFNKFPRIFNIIRNLIYPLFLVNLSKFFRDEIDENLIIMGAYGGHSFTDNTKYLFKFLSKKSNYKLIWIAKSNELISNLRKNGYNVIRAFSIKAIKYLRRAKFIFLTHGYVDVMPIKFALKTAVFLTWHGTPIKIINKELDDSYIYQKWGDIFKIQLRFDQYVDYILSAPGGEREIEILCSAFRTDKKKIKSLGFPRNDIFFNEDEDFLNSIKEKNKIPNKFHKIFLYAPTWRDDLRFDIPLSQRELLELNKVLKEMKALLLIKAHIFADKIQISDYENFKLVEKNSDIMELAVISDALISDYSSIILDFLLTMKPILLFTFDLEEYGKSRGFYYNFKDIAPGPIILNGVELIEAIRNIDQIDLEYREIREKLRDKFNKYIDGKSTERILNFLKISFNNAIERRV